MLLLHSSKGQKPIYRVWVRRCKIRGLEMEELEVQREREP